MNKTLITVFILSLICSACAVNTKKATPATDETQEKLEENQRAYIPLIPDGAGEQIFFVE